MRFSSAPQDFGDSIRRQTELRDTFLAESGLNLELDTSLNMTDKALSGYDGSNVEKGALGAFLKAVEDGTVKRGSYLLIENLDRLSRQSLDVSMLLLLNIVKSGIYIVTLSDGNVIKPGKQTLYDMLPVMVELERAHKESERKSQTIGAAWKSKKAAVLEGGDHLKLTKWCPKWLKLSDDRKSYEVNGHRVELIKEILKWVIAGYGSSRIIQLLEAQGEEPWESNDGVKSDKRKPKRWHLSMIQRIVRNRALLGEYELKRKNPETEKVEYITIPDYYPNVLEGEENLFYEAQIARTKRDVMGDGNRTSGNRGKAFSNLFAGIAYCGYSLDDNGGQYRCAGKSEPMVYVNKGQKSPIKYLQCGFIKGGNSGCEECSKMWRYDYFETAFLKHVKGIDVSELLGTNEELDSEVKALNLELSKNQDKLSELKKKQKNLKETIQDLLSEGQPPRMYTDMLSELESDMDQLPKDIRRLKSQLKVKTSEKNNPKNFKAELSDLISLMEECEDETELYDIRTKLSSLLSKVIDKIEVYTKGQFFNEQQLQEMLDKFPEEMAKERDEFASDMRKKEAEKQKVDKRGRRHIGFFVVRYKSGESRLIRHHPLDPNELTTNVKYDPNNKAVEHFDSRSLEKLYLDSVKTRKGKARDAIEVIFGKQ